MSYSSRRSRTEDEGMESLQAPRRSTNQRNPSFPTESPFQTESEARSSQRSASTQDQLDKDLKLKTAAKANMVVNRADIATKDNSSSFPSTDMKWQSPSDSAVGAKSAKGIDLKKTKMDKIKGGGDFNEKGTHVPQYFPNDGETTEDAVSGGNNDSGNVAQIGAFAVLGRQVEPQHPGFISPHEEIEDVQGPQPATLPSVDPTPNTTNNTSDLLSTQSNASVEEMPIAAVISPETGPTNVEEEVRRILAENTVAGQVIAIGDNENNESTSAEEQGGSGTSATENAKSESNVFCNKYIILASALAGLVVAVVVAVVVALSVGGGGGGSSSSSNGVSGDSPTPSPTTKVVQAVEDFCSDFSDIETYLARSFIELFDAPPFIRSDGYDCTCITQDPLEMKCDLSYSIAGNQSIFINSEMCTFVLKDGRYLRSSAGWCETVEGSDNSHCETVEFCEDGESLCSCSTNQGSDCPSCAICTNRKDIALDCSGVDNEAYNTVSSCKDEYSGALLNRYQFPDIGEAPTRNPTMAPIMPTESPTKPTASPTEKPSLTPPSPPTSTPTSSPILPTVPVPTKSPTLKPTLTPTLPPTVSPPTQSPPTVPPQFCEENSDCTRGACAFETFTSSAQNVCCQSGEVKRVYDWDIENTFYPKPDTANFCTGQATDAACPYNQLCQSRVCVFGKCKDDYQSPGASCDNNDDCRSSVCVGEVCKATKQKASDPCEEDLDCAFNACGFERFTGSAQLVCCPSGVRDKIYDWQVSPYPKSDDGYFCTGQATGDPCPYNKLCESNVCVYGTCMSGRQASGSICDDNEDCESSVCISQMCQASKKGPLELCEDNDDCESNACAFETFTGSAQNVCCPNGIREKIYDWQVSPYPKSDDGYFCTGQAAGEACPYNDLCESGVCVFGQCQSAAQPAGATCDDNLDCQSRVCVSQVCQTGRQSASDPCEENEDCEFNACGFEQFTGSAQLVCCPSGVRVRIYDWQVSPYPKSDDGYFCTGQATGDSCPFNQLCESSVCVSGKCKADTQADGAACDDNEDCQSGVCVSQVCKENYQAVDASCDDNVDCISGKCAYKSYTGSAQMVCCSSGHKKIYDFQDDAYPKSDDAYFCTDQPTGARCPFNELCASNKCTLRVCE